MTEEDRGTIARMLRESGLFTPTEIEWMSDTAPSIKDARALIDQRRRSRPVLSDVRPTK